MKKRLLVTASAAMMALGMSMSAMAADVPTDYEEYFAFDGDTGKATAVEKGSGAEVGEATEKGFTYVDGKNGQAIAINDSGDDIGLDTNVTLNGSDSYTISFWAKAYDAPFAAPIVWAGATSQNPEAWVGIWAGFNNGEWQSAMGIGSNDAAGARIGATSPLGDLNTFGWDYITMTVDASDYVGHLYYNGVEVKDTGVALPVLGDGSHIYVGANAWDAPANMEIDDLVIFKRALSADEVKALYDVNGLPKADAQKVEQEETTVKEKPKVSTAAPGVSTTDTVVEESNSSAPLIIGIVAGVLVVAIVVAVLLATRKKR